MMRFIRTPAAYIRSQQLRAGFTLIEVLVVISIIGVLVALTVPAVQMARESARRSSCANNLRQLAVSAKLHTDAQGTFPTGGWGPDWVGDPDAGFGPKQPGGWIYNVLPYLEQQSTRELGRGQPVAEKRRSIAQLLQMPIEVFICSSRRAYDTYPYNGSPSLKNADPPAEVAKSDYVINKLLSFEKSRVIIADIQLGKGMSRTVLVGEKGLSPDHYVDGQSAGDMLSMYQGDCEDVARNVGGTAAADEAAGAGGFASAHPSVCQFAYCDGSVKAIAHGDQIDP
jgi:prepilin-type N-terminal cleavage/methylation domain-containing protein